jgi:hypothetical protein
LTSPMRLVIMAKDKKSSKGPQHRNSNYQMKNGNAVSKKNEKKTEKGKPVEAKAAPKAETGAQKGLMAGISSSISGATSSLSKMLKH